MIIDKAAQFLDEQREDLVDFIFRLTSDRGRAGVMGREAIRQLQDELASMPEPDELKMRLFQRAYELNEEALRPLQHGFLEDYFRFHISDVKTLGRYYRWELFLIQLNQYSSLLLLLIYRYGFDEAGAAFVLGRETDDIKEEVKALLRLVKKQKFELEDLRGLPRYGFIEKPLTSQTSLSHVSRGLQPRRRYRWVFSLIGVGLIIAGVYYLLKIA